MALVDTLQEPGFSIFYGFHRVHGFNPWLCKVYPFWVGIASYIKYSIAESIA